jgi:hypothetical protein
MVVPDANWSTMADPSVRASYISAEQEKAQLWAAAASTEPHMVYLAQPQLYTHAPAPLEHAASQAQPSVENPAPEAVLPRGLHVPSKSELVSSGFPYPSVLERYGVGAASWAAFTAEVASAASMKPGDWALCLGGSSVTVFLASAFIAGFAILPAYLVGRDIKRRCESDNLLEARLNGNLDELLRRWNEEFFAPRGLRIRVDLPGESYDLSCMDVHAKRGFAARAAGLLHKGAESAAASAAAATASLAPGLSSSEPPPPSAPPGDECARAKTERKLQRLREKEAQRLEKDARKAGKKEVKVRKQAARRGRIVIIPLAATSAGAAAPVQPLTPQTTAASSSSPAALPPVPGAEQRQHVAGSAAHSDQYASSLVA